MAQDVAWKKVSLEVLRSPKYTSFLACLCGCGVQVGAMSCLVVFAILTVFHNTEWRPHF